MRVNAPSAALIDNTKRRASTTHTNRVSLWCSQRRNDDMVEIIYTYNIGGFLLTKGSHPLRLHIAHSTVIYSTMLTSQATIKYNNKNAHDKKLNVW